MEPARWNRAPSRLLRCRQAVAGHYAEHHGLELDWQSEVVVTSGATEAISAAILSLVSEDDEVVLIQPLYDAYLPMVRRAGGIPRLVRLEPPHWTLDDAALDAVMGPKTRLLIFNNPARQNAISTEMMVDSLEVIETYETMASVQVIVLRGAGEKAFISGGDISGAPVPWPNRTAIGSTSSSSPK